MQSHHEYFLVIEILFLKHISFSFKIFTPMRDQDRISPYNIDTIPGRQVIRKKKKYQLGDHLLIQYRILRTNIIIISWQTVRRIANEIWELKGLRA